MSKKNCEQKSWKRSDKSGPGVTVISLWMTLTPCHTWLPWERFVQSQPICRREQIHSLVQEVLRVNPAGFEVRRAAKKDDVLPLSKPIVGVSGKVYNELFVPAGTMAFVSTIGYNMYVCPLNSDSPLSFTVCRNKDVWGQDAYEFRPERWLEIDQKPDSPLGIYGNLFVTYFNLHRCTKG